MKTKSQSNCLYSYDNCSGLKFKKKRLFLMVIICIAFLNISYSQIKDSLKIQSLNITTTICDYYSMIGTNAYNFNLGSEIYIKNRNSLALNFGLIKSFEPSKGIFSIYSLKTKGFKFQTEYKHYFGKHQLFQPAIILFWPHILQYHTKKMENSGYYYSFQMAFQQTSTKRDESIFDYINDWPYPNTSYYKNNFYTVERTVYRMNLKIGYQCVKINGLTIDYAIGLGVKYLDSFTKNQINKSESWPQNEKDLIIGHKLFEKGHGFYPDVVHQFKIGFGKTLKKQRQ